MEGTGTTTTTALTSGIVSPVKGFGRDTHVIASPRSAAKQSQTQPANASEFRSNKTRSESVSNSENVIIHENPLSVSDNQSFEDSLLDVAKKEGIEAAFETLAFGE